MGNIERVPDDAMHAAEQAASPTMSYRASARRAVIAAAPLIRKPLADQLAGAVEAVRAHRDRWYEANSKTPDEARPSDRELWRVVLGSDAAGGQ